MNLITLIDGHKKGTMPISLTTAYSWHASKRYPALIIKVANRLYFDLDEWDDMVIKARERQIEEAKRFKAKILKTM